MFGQRALKLGAGIGTGILAAAASYTTAYCHCQVPCGIYDDEGRIKTIKEDALTIRKATTNIQKLAGSNSAQDMNQLVRWVNTKEAHASDIITTVAEYFLTQKVKPVDDKDSKEYEEYLQILESHHRLMRAAMVCKQKADLDAVHDLDHILEDCGLVYGVYPPK